jgi:hypothetical protein
MTVSADQLPSWRGAPAKHAIVEFVDAVTDPDAPDFVPELLQWTAASPYRTLELVVHHTDAEREYAYDRDPILGSGTDQILATAADQKWTVIDMAADWANVHSAS